MGRHLAAGARLGPQRADIPGLLLPGPAAVATGQILAPNPSPHLPHHPSLTSTPSFEHPSEPKGSRHVGPENTRGLAATPALISPLSHFRFGRDAGGGWLLPWNGKLSILKKTILIFFALHESSLV